MSAGKGEERVLEDELRQDQNLESARRGRWA